jgi:hypothetical protein
LVAAQRRRASLCSSRFCATPHGPTSGILTL